MDNLAHALTSSIIGSAVAPNLVKKAPIKFCLISAVIVNLPDVDFFLNFISEEYYHFHHRGFTHSVFGALIFIPLSYFIYLNVMKTSIVENGSESTKQLWVLSAVQVLFGHYLLDYLTTYGTMFLYPASMQRFSLPLMFIVDPVYWFIGLIGLVSILFTALRTGRGLRQVAIMALLAIVAWWLILFFYKEESKNLMSKAYPDSEVIESYPGPGAPILWVALARESERYIQLATPFFTGAKNTPSVQADNQSYNQLCSSLTNDSVAMDSFREFLSWAEYAVCLEDESSECVCSGLKYSFMKWPNDPSFGKFSFEKAREGRFIPPEMSPGYIGHLRELMGL